MFPTNKEANIAAALCSLLIGAAALLLQNRRDRRWWIKPWLNRKRGNIDLPKEFIEGGDFKSYQNFLRMDEATFNKLLEKIQSSITKQSIYRECISAKDKLVITLRYLATGETYRSLMYSFKISESTISLFIPEVCKAIYKELKDEYLHVPRSTAEWLEISREFDRLWNLPNVVGAIDGKHIRIAAPSDEGSAFYNYKNDYSIVLLALVDANYNFTYVNIGMNGRISDGGVYRESDLYEAVEKNTLNFPEDKPLPSRTEPVPHVIVADAAFALSCSILKPYPFKGLTREQRIFNYRLSRVRRVVENTFGILANRFRILLNVIPLTPSKAKIITQACVALHNFLRKELNLQYLGINPEEDIDRRFRFVYGLSRQTGNRPKNEAIRIREEFKEYVNGCGSVPWQDNMI